MQLNHRKSARSQYCGIFLVWILLCVTTSYVYLWKNVRYVNDYTNGEDELQNKSARPGLKEKQYDLQYSDKDDGIHEVTSKMGLQNESPVNDVERAILDLLVSLKRNGTQPTMDLLQSLGLVQTTFAPEPVTQKPERVLPKCPRDSPYLIGRQNVDILNVAQVQTNDALAAAFPEIAPGGYWKPKDCIPRHKLAVVIPFRDRQSHLNMFITYMIPILKRQLLEFFFVVAEQNGTDLFNKGRVLNAGFEFAETIGFDTVVFHDVDMIPEDDRNYYGCPDPPRHIAPFTDSLNYELWYYNLVGGALCFRKEQFRQMNGYSEEFWGWGGEDDDMGNRILAHNFTISRPSPLIGRYKMFQHKKRHNEAFEKRWDLLATSKTRWKVDGLRNKRWDIVQVEQYPLYFHVLVDVGDIPEGLQPPPTPAASVQQTSVPFFNGTVQEVSTQ